MRNIEIKARVGTLDELRGKAAAIAGEGPVEMFQDDTFFNCPAGRLKLRVPMGGMGELIFYRRAGGSGPKESFYVRSPAPDADSLREALTLGYGQRGRVRKHRTLYRAGRTRIHLDTVENLGSFLELEVVLDGDEPSAAGIDEAHELMRVLGVDSAQLVDGAYIDLLSDSAPG